MSPSITFSPFGFSGQALNNSASRMIKETVTSGRILTSERRLSMENASTLPMNPYLQGVLLTNSDLNGQAGEDDKPANRVHVTVQ